MTDLWLWQTYECFLSHTSTLNHINQYVQNVRMPTLEVNYIILELLCWNWFHCKTTNNHHPSSYRSFYFLIGSLANLGESVRQPNTRTIASPAPSNSQSTSHRGRHPKKLSCSTWTLFSHQKTNHYLFVLICWAVSIWTWTSIAPSPCSLHRSVP